MAWNDASSKLARRRLRNEAILWLLLIALAVAGLQDILAVVGSLFVLPGIILILAPNLLLYGFPLRLAVELGRRWRWSYVIGALAILGLGAALALVPPMKVNARLAADVRRLQAQDFDKVAPSSPAPRTVAFGDDCSQDCRRLLELGLAARIVTPLTQRGGEIPGALKAVFRLVDAEACRNAGVAAEKAVRGCILRGIENDPKVDAVMKVEALRYAYRDMETREQRLDPSELGRQSAQRAELWLCSQGCALALQRTYVSQERLVAPLVLGTDQNKLGFGMERAWMRLPWGAEFDPVAFMASKWPVKGPPSNVARGQDLVVVHDIDAAARRSTFGLDYAGLREILRDIQTGSGPLSASEKALLRELFRKPGPQGIPNDDLAQRPEVVEAVKDELGPLLMALAAQRSKALGGELQPFDDPDAETRVNTQRLIAALPDADYRRLHPILRRWLESGALKGRPNDERFLARLENLKATIE